MARVSTDRYNRLVMDWMPLPLRLAVIWVAMQVAHPEGGPASFIIWKFTNPEAVIPALEGLGVPAPVLFNYVVGIIEVVFVVTVVLGLYARIPALFMLVEMIFAIYFQGPVLNNTLMITLAFVILVGGTGKFSIRNYNLLLDLYERFGDGRSTTTVTG